MASELVTALGTALTDCAAADLTALSSLEVGEMVIDLRRVASRLEAEIARAVHAVSQAEAWQVSGATSIEAWLAAETNVSIRSARDQVRLAGTLAAAPVVAEKMADGSLSVDNSRLLGAVVGEERFADDADLLLEIASGSSYNSGTVTGGRERPKVLMTVPFETVVERGAARGVTIGVDATISGEAVRKLCCDAELNRVVTRGRSAILDYGTTTRLASDSQYYALVARDGGCRWPGCDRPPGWCQVHHIDEVFLEDGPTDLNKMDLNCSTHRDYDHNRGWNSSATATIYGCENPTEHSSPHHHADQHSPTHNNSNWSTHECHVAQRRCPRIRRQRRSVPAGSASRGHPPLSTGPTPSPARSRERDGRRDCRRSLR